MILAFYTESRIYYQHNKQYNKNLLYLPTLEGAQGVYIQIPTDLILSDFVSWLVLWVLRWQPHGLSPVSRRATGFRGHKIDYTTDKQTHRQAGAQTDRQSDGRTHRKRDRQTDRDQQTNRPIKRQTGNRHTYEEMYQQTNKQSQIDTALIQRYLSKNKITNNLCLHRFNKDSD